MLLIFLSVDALLLIYILFTVPTICTHFSNFPLIMAQNTGSVVHVCRRAVSFHSMNTTNTTTTPHKPQHHSGSVQHRPSASPSPNNRSINLAQVNPAVPLVLHTCVLLNNIVYMILLLSVFTFSVRLLDSKI